MKTEAQVIQSLAVKIAEKIKNDPMEEIERCIYKVLKENILSFNRTHTVTRNVIRDINVTNLKDLKENSTQQTFSMMGHAIMENEDYSIIEEGVLSPYLDHKTKTTVLVIKTKGL